MLISVTSSYMYFELLDRHCRYHNLLTTISTFSYILGVSSVRLSRTEHIDSEKTAFLLFYFAIHHNRQLHYRTIKNEQSDVCRCGHRELDIFAIMH